MQCYDTHILLKFVGCSVEAENKITPIGLLA